jgi:hypothetical protein
MAFDTYTLKRLGLKFQYKIDNKTYYEKFGVNYMQLIVYDPIINNVNNDLICDWTIYHYSLSPTPDEISLMIIQMKENEKDMGIVLENMINWIETCIEDELNEFDETADDCVDDTNSDKEHIISTCVPTNMEHNKKRKLYVYVWGRKLRAKLPDKCEVQHNFNACVLHGRKDGVDWRNDARDATVRLAVMKGNAFYDFMKSIVQTIEKKQLSRIGINCAKGRHRSVTCAIALKEYFYPDSELFFLELR